MAFTQKTWVDGSNGGTPITAVELNRIEAGVKALDGFSESGSGSPVSVRSAPQGSYYRDLAQTNGAQLWYKATGGTGSTGWIVVQGDTGWRMISDLYQPGIEASSETAMTVRRINHMVYHRYAGYVQSSNAFLYMPEGFRNAAPYDRPMFTKNVGATTATTNFFHLEYQPSYGEAPGHMLKVFNYWRTPITTSTRLAWNYSYLTNDIWPVGTLPGTGVAN